MGRIEYVLFYFYGRIKGKTFLVERNSLLESRNCQLTLSLSQDILKDIVEL